jgi:hypothetical protein
LRLFKKIWRRDRFPEPGDFNEEDLKEISKLLWRPRHQSKQFFDFGDKNHLYTFFGMI